MKRLTIRMDTLLAQQLLDPIKKKSCIKKNGRAINGKMKKGTKTKIAILDAGLEMASRLGLECVSIGALAKETNMSKSGLFAHFRSKETLQIEILDFAAERFSDDVIMPALHSESGIPRIKTLLENWINWSTRLAGGCIFVIASNEYSDRPGNVRDCLLKQQESWIDCLARIAESVIKTGEFREDIDCEQFAFELYSLMLGFHLYHKLFHQPDIQQRQEQALKRLLENFM